MPQQQIDEMSPQLQEQKQSMLKLAGSASADDKKFAKENLSWIMENLPEEAIEDERN